MIANLCTFLTEGMDACDKVSQLMKCGKENSPDLVSAVMTNLENSIKVKKNNNDILCTELIF
jgi:hypothetical protein